MTPRRAAAARAAAAIATLGRRLRRLLAGRPVDAGGETPVRLPTGQVLGPYHLGSEIGRGSVGTVYLGQDGRTGRPVAIKLFAPGRSPARGRRSGGGAGLNTGIDPRQIARDRFLAEARTAGQLHHPGIVAWLDAGTEGELAFIVMEHVTGGDLSAHTVAGRLLPVRTVLGIGVQVARALAHAHRQGVVHRDIKPGNLLAVDASCAAVKIADFGIARLATPSDAWRSRTGQVFGSPSFMSPEQMAGQAVDGRTDLYALGVVLFQLLTGALPHPTESVGRLMQAIAHDTAPDVRSLRPSLPESLAHIVALALEKRPALRYASGDAFADDLAAVRKTLLASEP